MTGINNKYAYVQLEDAGTGVIRGYAICIGTKTLIESETVVFIDYEQHADILNDRLPKNYLFLNGKFVQRPPQPNPVYPYDLSRVLAYPSVGDQLGAVMKGGQELLDMQERIREVKAMYPKRVTPS